MCAIDCIPNRRSTVSPNLVPLHREKNTHTTNKPTMSTKKDENLTLMIDNYDSFTYNVYQVCVLTILSLSLSLPRRSEPRRRQYLCELVASVKVIRNDKITVKECVAMNPSRVVISPGPGDPSSAGISMDVIKEFAGKIPILRDLSGSPEYFSSLWR